MIKMADHIVFGSLKAYLRFLEITNATDNEEHCTYGMYIDDPGHYVYVSLCID